MDGRRFRASGITEPGLQADSSAVRLPWPRRSVDHRGSGHVGALRASRISAPSGFAARRSPNRFGETRAESGLTPSGPRHAYETEARAADREPGLNRPGGVPGVGSASGTRDRRRRPASPSAEAVTAGRQGGAAATALSCCETVRPLLGITCATCGCPPSGRRRRRGTATGPRCRSSRTLCSRSTRPSSPRRPGAGSPP